jgi:hypothetical protein
MDERWVTVMGDKFFILSYFRRCYWFRSDSLMADGYDRCILGFNTITNKTQLISCKPEKFKVGNIHSELHRMAQK